MSEEKHIELVTSVMDALEKIRPFLQKDGGDIEFVDVKDNIVYVRLVGNCSSCHINTSTLKLGVETTVKEHVPSIVSVVNVE